MTKILDKDTKQSIEWDLIIKEWKKRCVTQGGKNLVEVITIFNNWENSSHRLRMIEEIRNLKREERSLYIQDIPELSEIFSSLEKGGFLKAKDLHKIVLHLKNVKEILQLITQETSELFNEFSKLDALFYLMDLLNNTIDEEGNIRSDASPKLYGLRSRAQILRKEIIKKLEIMMQYPSVSPYLQDQFYTIREERYVLPIKSEFRSQVPGMIHGISSSGQTVYIEPHALVELNNRIREIHLDIEIEELKILSDLGDAIVDELPKLKKNISLLHELDVWIAAAKLSDELSLEPWEFGEKLVLKNVKHPILLAMGVNVVGNDVALEKSKILLVTGPNAGGKTILLKTIGLVIGMASVGLPVPSKYTQIPKYRKIHAIIGDSQNITEHKSTFSGHLERLKHILEQVQGDDIVLIDELASGTDPSQGAAIAQAVLEYIVEQGATTVATTHYSVLKSIALTDQRFLNASIGGAGLLPDYKLVLGVPGVSSGIELANRLGLPKSIVTRAKEIFKQGDKGLDELFIKLREKEKKLAKLTRELEKEIEQVSDKESKLENKIRECERQRIEIIKKKRDEAVVALERINSMITILEQRIKNKKKVTRKDLEYFKRSTQKLRNSIKEIDRSITQEPDIKVGKRLYSLSLGKVVEVIDIKHNRVRVSFGALQLEVSKDDLRSSEYELIQGDVSLQRNFEKGDGKKKLTGLDKKEISIEPKQERSWIHVMKPSTTLDLRGKRVEEALNELERFIDDIMLKNESSFAVVHGFGSGALRKAVRDFLSNSPYISSYRPGEKGEGGDGVTIGFCI